MPDDLSGLVFELRNELRGELNRTLGYILVVKLGLPVPGWLQDDRIPRAVARYRRG